MDGSAFYIGGAWVSAGGAARRAVINPATEKVIGSVALAGQHDVDAAVAAAGSAFPAFAASSSAERAALLVAIRSGLVAAADDLAAAMTAEMGAPVSLSRSAQVGGVFAHLDEMIAAAARPSLTTSGRTAILREPIGVCGLITPWNWPLLQIAMKVFPALAAGCTVVLKPSEIAPLSAALFAEVLHQAGVPRGVFNMVQGDGPGAGAAVAAHTDIAMVSFTGSTRGGVAVSKTAAETVKRVTLELGGKSPNIVLDDADLGAAVAQCVALCMSNSGQSCNAPTRMLVPRARMADAAELARAAAAALRTGDPLDAATDLGPVANARQFTHVQRLIRAGIDEGAMLVCGGPDRPEGLPRGFYVRPTIFSGVSNDMTIAREEIFGPVLAILPYDDEADAIAIANDTPYGLSAYIQSGDLDHARAVARQLRAGNVHINDAPDDPAAPFGGFKQSGNGREGGLFGFEEYLESKAVMGWGL